MSQTSRPAIGDSVDVEHVPMKRLLYVAASEDAIFTLAEFIHLKECAECFTTWAAFIAQMIRGNVLDLAA